MARSSYNNSQSLEDRTASGDRLHSPSAARNRDAIAQALAPRLPEGARVLEIASGTGEHAARLLAERPDIQWQPSDIDAASRASQATYVGEFGGRMGKPLALDMMENWWRKFGRVPRFDALFCANMVHISPWAATLGLAQGARQVLGPGGVVALYGPFLHPDSPPSNHDFDASLRARDPAWGVRARADVKAMFAKHGLAMVEVLSMPANNEMLVFRRA